MVFEGLWVILWIYSNKNVNVSERLPPLSPSLHLFWCQGFKHLISEEADLTHRGLASPTWLGGGSLQLHVTKSHGDRWKERNYIEKAVLAPQNFYIYFSLNGRIRNNPMKCFYYFILVSFMKAWTLEKHLNSPHDLWILSGWSSYSFQLWHWVPKFHRVMTPFEFQRCEVEIDISLHLFWVNVLKCHVFPVIDI